MSNIPIWKQPLCDCADKGAYCLGKQENIACMANDEWYKTPCSKGECGWSEMGKCCGNSRSGSYIDEVDEDSIWF